MDHPCKFCERSFSSGRELGSHVRSCVQNPKYAEIKAKRIVSQTHERLNYVLTCLNCGDVFKLVLSKNQFETGAHKKHCSNACANRRMISEEIKTKIRTTLQTKSRLPEFVKETCLICHESFKRKRRAQTKTCSNVVCRFQYRSERMKGNLSGKRGGYRPRSVEIYNGTSFDSRWEVVLAKRLDELQIQWERNSQRRLLYIDMNGKHRHYHPDFYLPAHDLYLEVKGYATAATKHKMMDAMMRNNVQLTILTSIVEIQTFKI